MQPWEGRTFNDEPLTERLRACKEAWRTSFKQEKTVVKAMTDDGERGAAKRELYWRYYAPFHMFGWQDSCGLLNITLEMVKRGDGILASGICIRDDYLVDWWARRNGYDLSEMARQRADFFEWVKSHAGSIGRSEHFRLVSLSRQADPQFLACAARVCYRCEFEDGKSAYLEEFRLLTPDLSDLERLRNLLEGDPGGAHSPEQKQGKTISAQLSAKRSRAGKMKAQVQDPEDISKIKNAFWVRAESFGVSHEAAAKMVCEMVEDDANPLRLNQGPYYIGVDAVKRIAGVK